VFSIQRILAAHTLLSTVLQHRPVPPRFNMTIESSMSKGASTDPPINCLLTFLASETSSLFAGKVLLARVFSNLGTRIG
jgi:hypothetical protein